MGAPFASFDVAAAVTPSDTVNFDQGKCRAIYVGGAGNVTAVVGGIAVLFTAPPVGTTLNIGATRVTATGTTATALVALY